MGRIGKITPISKSRPVSRRKRETDGNPNVMMKKINREKLKKFYTDNRRDRHEDY
jgi:hypothetical protein